MNLFWKIAVSVGCVLLPVMCPAKTAILVAHYGSSEEDTRHKTIDLITRDIAEAFPGIEVREAYISPIVREKLAKKGLHYLSPAEALNQLYNDGYDTVVVQSSTIIEGAEMADVRKAVAEKTALFKDVKVGRPLCYSPDDCWHVAENLASQAPADSMAVVYVGHGNNLPSTATYCQLDYMLHERGIDNVHVSTIEGYPTPLSTIAELQHQPGVKTVILRPLLLVCGNHTKTDIAIDFATALNDAGYATDVVYEGFAENPEIRHLYVTRVREMLNN